MTPGPGAEGRLRCLRWTNGTPPPADPGQRPRLPRGPLRSRAARWRGLRIGRLRTPDAVPIFPRGTALFEGIPAPAIVIEALAPVIGDGALVSRRSGSVGVILIKEAGLFEVYAFEGGKRFEGQRALQLISEWTDATVSAYQLDRNVVAAAPSLFRGTPCHEDLRLEWTDWKGLLADLCEPRRALRGGVRHADRPGRHHDPGRAAGGHLHGVPSGARSGGFAGSAGRDQAGDHLGSPRAGNPGAGREADPRFVRRSHPDGTRAGLGSPGGGEARGRSRATSAPLSVGIGWSTAPLGSAATGGGAPRAPRSRPHPPPPLRPRPPRPSPSTPSRYSRTPTTMCTPRRPSPRYPSPRWPSH